MRAVLVCLLTLGLSGCGGPTVDLKQGLEVLEFSSGWLDAGIVEGKNKLVPSITFKLKNVSDQPLRVLQVNVNFWRQGDTTAWSSRFSGVVGSEGLAPGATSQAVTLDSDLGYTGTEARADMMKNAAFVDAKVEIFAKYSSAQWTKVDERPIARELITR